MEVLFVTIFLAVLCTPFMAFMILFTFGLARENVRNRKVSLYNFWMAFAIFSVALLLRGIDSLFLAGNEEILETSRILGIVSIAQIVLAVIAGIVENTPGGKRRYAVRRQAQEKYRDRGASGSVLYETYRPRCPDPDLD